MKVKKRVMDALTGTARLALTLMSKYVSKRLMHLELYGQPMNLLELYTLLGYDQNTFDRIITNLVRNKVIAILLGDDFELIAVNPNIFSEHRMTPVQERISDLIFRNGNAKSDNWQMPSVLPDRSKASKMAIRRLAGFKKKNGK